MGGGDRGLAFRPGSPSYFVKGPFHLLKAPQMLSEKLKGDSF